MNNSFIKLFSNFGELKVYSEEGKDQEIKTMIKLFEEIISNTINIKKLRGVDNIEELVKLLKTESTTDYLYSTYAVSTVHKSKGLEWENVILLDDFIDIEEAFIEIDKLSGEKKKENLEKLLEEISILYVASTRAKQKIQINDKYLIKDLIYKNFLHYGLNHS